MVFRGYAIGGGGGSVDPATLPRLVIYSQIAPTDFVSLGLTNGASGEQSIPDWLTPLEEVGSAFDYSGTSALDLLHSGVYSVSINIGAIGIDASDPACSLRYRVLPYVAAPIMDCGVRGGDGAPSWPALPSSGYSYYVDLETDPGALQGHMDFFFYYSAFDADNIGTISFTTTIQRVA